MRAHWMKRWRLLVGALLTSVLLLSACQVDPAVTASSTILEMKSAPAPESALSVSGVRLTAHISSPCTRTVCPQPYAGEFVVTELNGAEVTRVFTNQAGQAMVSLPPGQYLLGVRTEEIYPLAAPVTVNILANRYVSVDLSLIAGMQQVPSQ